MPPERDAPLRVLALCASWPPDACGVADYSRALYSALHRRPDVHLRVLTASHALDDPYLLPAPDWTARSLGWAAAAMRAERPDLIHVQYPMLGSSRSFLDRWLALLARARFRIPVVSTLHEHLTRWWEPSHLLARLSSAIVVVRPDFAERIARTRLTRGLASRIHLVPGASSIPRSSLDAAGRAALRRELGVPDGARLLAYFGWLLPNKQPHLLFELADPERDFVVILGGEYPGHASYRERVQGLAAAPAWHERSRVLGFVERELAADLLAAADLVVLPIEDGGGTWNSSVAAALNQGTPVIAFDSDAARSDPEGLLLRVRDREEMRGRIAAGGWSRGSPRGGSWDEVAAEHVRLYRDAAGARPAS